VYEPIDYEKAIAILASKTLPLDKLISRVIPLEPLQQAFEELDVRTDAMKILIDCTNSKTP